MIAIDLDGTLLNSQKRISPEDGEALQEAVERGIEVLPVTGRNFAFALPAVRELAFEVNLITSNGAVLRSRAGQTYFRCLLAEETAAAVLEATREFRPYTVLMYDQAGEGLLRIEGSPAGASATPGSKDWQQGVAASSWVHRNRSLVRFVDSLEQALAGPPLEILFAGPIALIREAEARLEAALPGLVSGNGGRVPVHQSFRLLRTEYPEQGFSMLDVIRGDRSKGQGLEDWSRMRGIAPAEILAIGDNYNDLEMLRFAGVPVVMGNASEALKQQGWPVTLDCDSCGVSRAIRRYAL